MTQETPSKQIRPLGIKYVSISGDSGYAIAAKRYILALVNSGIPLTWAPMIPNQPGKFWFAPTLQKEHEDIELSPFCNLEIEYDTVIVHMVPDYYPMWIEREPEKKIIGFTVWETDIIPPHWLKILNSVDALTVPCHWNKEVFIKNGVTVPISVLPHISIEPQTKKITELYNIPEDHFVFYTINTWTTRKSINLILEAYLRAFTSTDPITLVIKSTKMDNSKPEKKWKRFFGLKTRPYSRDQVKKIISRFPMPANILFIDEFLTDIEISELHQRGNCYVSLSRAEGWGLGAFDACAHGNLVAMTGYGGQLDFLNAEDAHLIKYKLVKIKDNSSSSAYRDEAVWAEPDLEHTVKTLKEIFLNKNKAEIKGKNLQKDVCTRFSATKIVNYLINFLNEYK